MLPSRDSVREEHAMRKLPYRLAFAAPLASLAACGAPDEISFDPRPAGTAPQSFKASANQRASSDPSRSATAFSAATTMLGKGTAVIGYASKPIGAPTAAWSFSADAGVTWSDHRSDEEGEFQWPKPPVGNGLFSYYGDAPTMISLDAFPGVVVATVSAYGPNAAAIDVIVLVSTDGGAHFKNPVLVYSMAKPIAPGESPAIDYVTAGPLVGPGEGAGATVWTLFRNHELWRIHKYTYNPISERMETKTVFSDYVALNLDSTHNKVPTGPASILASFDGMGMETIYVAWPSYDNHFDACPSSSPLSATVDVRWRLSYVPWTDGFGFEDYWKAIDLGHDASWPRC